MLVPEGQLGVLSDCTAGELSVPEGHLGVLSDCTAGKLSVPEGQLGVLTVQLGNCQYLRGSWGY